MLQTIIAKLSDTEFGTHIQSLVTRKLEKDKQLRQESNRYFGEVLDGYYHFGRGPSG